MTDEITAVAIHLLPVVTLVDMNCRQHLLRQPGLMTCHLVPHWTLALF